MESRRFCLVAVISLGRGEAPGPDVYMDLPCSASGEVLSFGVTLSWEYEDSFPHLKLLAWL